MAPPGDRGFLFMFLPQTILHFINSLRTPKCRSSKRLSGVIHLEGRAHHHNQGNKMNLLKTQREALLAPLQAVTGIIERRHTLPILSNVLLSRTDNNIEFVATDIEIEITTSMTIEEAGDTKKITVGARKLVDILRALPEGSEVTLALQDKRLQVKSGKSRFNLETLSAEDFPRLALLEAQAKFKFGNVVLVSKLVDGKFPDYGRVIPQNHPKKLKLERIALLQALQRAAILTSDKFRGVRWVLGEGSLKISCSNTEQEEAQEDLDVPYKGETLDIGFNVGYLVDVLNNLDVAEVECGLGDANSSALFTLPGRNDFKYVGRPMRC